MTGCHKKIVCVHVGFTHTHPARFCSASGFVSICVASWKIVGLLSSFALMRPTVFAWCGQGVPDPCGALRWACSRRDFSGLGTWSPAKKIIAGDQTSLICFPRGRDTSRPARMREKTYEFWKLLEAISARLGSYALSRQSSRFFSRFVA